MSDVHQHAHCSHVIIASVMGVCTGCRRRVRAGMADASLTNTGVASFPHSWSAKVLQKKVAPPPESRSGRLHEISPVVRAMRCEQEQHHWHQRQELSVAGVLHPVIQLLPECHSIILALQHSPHRAEQFDKQGPCCLLSVQDTVSAPGRWKRYDISLPPSLSLSSMPGGIAFVC